MSARASAVGLTIASLLIVALAGCGKPAAVRGIPPAPVAQVSEAAGDNAVGPTPENRPAEPVGPEGKPEEAPQSSGQASAGQLPAAASGQSGTPAPGLTPEAGKPGGGQPGPAAQPSGASAAEHTAGTQPGTASGEQAATAAEGGQPGPAPEAAQPQAAVPGKPAPDNPGSPTHR